MPPPRKQTIPFYAQKPTVYSALRFKDIGKEEFCEAWDKVYPGDGQIQCTHFQLYLMGGATVNCGDWVVRSSNGAYSVLEDAEFRLRFASVAEGE